MHEARGDIWTYARDHDAHALCVLTNMTVASGRLIMGGGQARQARERHPELPELWGSVYHYRDRTEGDDSAVLALHLPLRRGENCWLVSFPTKYHPSDDSDLHLIERSAQELVNAADEYEWTRIVLPRPGCGLGGLTWDRVLPVLAEILDDRFTVITNT